jgi:hypothetical protein
VYYRLVESLTNKNSNVYPHHVAEHDAEYAKKHLACITLKIDIEGQQLLHE